jgi:hypothetical protein
MDKERDFTLLASDAVVRELNRQRTANRSVQLTCSNKGCRRYRLFNNIEQATAAGWQTNPVKCNLCKG